MAQLTIPSKNAGDQLNNVELNSIVTEVNARVETANVVNDLASTDATKVLAAPQGKALDDKITSLAGSTGSANFAYDNTYLKGTVDPAQPAGGADVDELLLVVTGAEVVLP